MRQAWHSPLAHILAQFDVPVRQIDKMFPTIVLVQAEIDLNEWPPLRTLGFANKVQPGLLRRAVGFESITFDAGADDILPTRRSPTVTRNYMVEVQVFAVACFAAVLAGILIALENVVSREFDLFLREMIIDQQQDDPWQPQSERDGANRFRMGFLDRNIAPFGEIVGLERAIVAVQNDLGMSLEEQR